MGTDGWAPWRGVDGLEQGGGDQAGGQDLVGGAWGRHSEPRRGEEGFLGVRVGAVGEGVHALRRFRQGDRDCSRMRRATRQGGSLVLSVSTQNPPMPGRGRQRERELAAHGSWANEEEH